MSFSLYPFRPHPQGLNRLARARIWPGLTLLRPSSPPAAAPRRSGPAYLLGDAPRTSPTALRQSRSAKEPAEDLLGVGRQPRSTGPQPGPVAGFGVDDDPATARGRSGRSGLGASTARRRRARFCLDQRNQALRPSGLQCPWAALCGTPHHVAAVVAPTQVTTEVTTQVTRPPSSSGVVRPRQASTFLSVPLQAPSGPVRPRQAASRDLNTRQIPETPPITPILGLLGSLPITRRHRL